MRIISYITAIFLLLNGSLKAQQEGDTPAQEYQYHGEYGLYVKKIGNELEVNWVAKQDEQGYLEVTSGDQPVFVDTTRVSRFHRLAVQLPKEGTYQLTYGSLDKQDERYNTTIITNPDRGLYDIKGVDSLYVLSDIHGQYDNFQKLLRNNGLVDEDLNWSGGTKHMVIVGDLFDRGADVTKLLWMLYRLEQQAREAGGGLHILLGNHEIMTFSGDLRYVSRKEFIVASFYGINYGEMYSVRTSLLGQWLATKPTIIRVDGALFTHGGMITDYGNYSLKTVNDSIYNFMKEPVFEHVGRKPLDTINFEQNKIEERQAFFYGMYSPFWFRGYIQSDTLSTYLDHILRQYKCTVHVVGHTTLETMTQFYKGKVICVDVKQGEDRALQLLMLRRKKRNKYDRVLYNIDGEPIELQKAAF